MILAEIGFTMISKIFNIFFPLSHVISEWFSTHGQYGQWIFLFPIWLMALCFGLFLIPSSLLVFAGNCDGSMPVFDRIPMWVRIIAGFVIMYAGITITIGTWNGGK